jgi:hypothetical protein
MIAGGRSDARMHLAPSAARSTACIAPNPSAAPPPNLQSAHQPTFFNSLLEHVRARQNQHLHFGNNGGCTGHAVTMSAVAAPVRHSAAAVVEPSNVKLL